MTETTRPDVLSWVRRSLKAGDLLGFFVVEVVDGSRRLSHHVEMVGRFYVVTGISGQLVGRFATFAAASKAGFAASAEILTHGQV